MGDPCNDTELDATEEASPENKSSTNGLDLLNHKEINGNVADSADVTASMAADLTAHVIADVIADVNLLSNENNIVGHKESTPICDDVVNYEECHNNIIQNDNEIIIGDGMENIATAGNDDSYLLNRTTNDSQEGGVQNFSSSNEFIEMREVEKSSETIDLSEAQDFKIEEKMDTCLPTTLITVESNITKSDFNFDLIKPGDDDSDVEMDRVYNKKETEINCENDEESEMVVDDSCLIGFENSGMNITVENNKQEINECKTTKFFEDDDDDDDDILVFDKPPVAVTSIVPPQTVEVVLEGIAEEPEDVKEEEFDSVIIKDDEEEEDDDKPGNDLMQLEELEDDKVEKKDNEPYSENVCETIETKIKREEESLEKFQQQEKQMEEQDEQEKQQLIMQQKQTEYHDYVNVPNLSPKQPSNGAFTYAEEVIKKEDVPSKDLIESSSQNGDVNRIADTSTENEANKAMLSEDDFNFEMEKDDLKVIDHIKNEVEQEEIENITQNELEKEKQTEKKQIAEKIVANEIEKTDSCVSGLSNDVGNYTQDKNATKIEEKDVKEDKQLDASKNIISEPKQKYDFKTSTGQISTQSSSVRATPRTPTCRTPTTPGTPNASSYIRYNDILPEAGCVKALVEQWSKRSSRADGLEDKGMNRSRSCGPISRKLKLMSPENELDHPLSAANKIGIKESYDQPSLYNSQPSLTRSILHKFEKLDQQASQKVTPKKTFKWEVKEANILKRPTYLPK